MWKLAVSVASIAWLTVPAVNAQFIAGPMFPSYGYRTPYYSPMYVGGYSSLGFGPRQNVSVFRRPSAMLLPTASAQAIVFGGSQRVEELMTNVQKMQKASATTAMNADEIRVKSVEKGATKAETIENALQVSKAWAIALPRNVAKEAEDIASLIKQAKVDDKIRNEAIKNLRDGLQMLADDLTSKKITKKDAFEERTTKIADESLGINAGLKKALDRFEIYFNNDITFVRNTDFTHPEVVNVILQNIELLTKKLEAK